MTFGRGEPLGKPKTLGTAALGEHFPFLADDQAAAPAALNALEQLFLGLLAAVVPEEFQGRPGGGGRELVGNDRPGGKAVAVVARGLGLNGSRVPQIKGGKVMFMA